MDSRVNKKLVLFITTPGAFIVPFMISAVNVALPSIGKEFAMGNVLLNWVVLSFTLSTAVFIFPFGRAADIIGRKKLLLYGMSAFTLATIMCGVTPNSGLLIAARVLQGISGATVSVTVMSIITSVYPPGERGRALGLNVGSTYIGLSAGPFLGGLLTKYFGWRSVFFAVVPIGIFIIILLLKLKQDWAEAKGEKFDYMGSLIYGAGLFGIVCGLSFIRWIYGIILMILGLFFIIFFGYFEVKVQEPILDMGLLKRNRILKFSSIAALINYCATATISYILSLYFQHVKGLDPQQAGIILVAQPIVQALFSPIAGRLSDKIEPQKVASLGMTFTTTGLAFLIFLSENTHLYFIITALLILGFGFALFSSPNTNAVMNSVEKKYYGVSSGILGAARSVGQALGMGITSFIMVIYMGNVQINSSNADDFLVSVNIIFTILSILSVAGIFASLARGKVKNAENN